MADRRLQVFHAVAKHLSFTKAAEALFMTQPAVTFQIKQLEEHFNTRLFERGHGRIGLTPAGHIVLEYAERILALSAELDTRVKEMTGEVSGPLLVGASTTIAEFLLPQVLGEFKSRNPKVQPRLVVGNSETVESRVAEHTLDIGFIEAPSHLASVVTVVCCEDELQAGCAPTHPLARLKSATAKQLAQFPYISREQGAGTREVTDQYFRKAGVAPESLNVVMELGSPEALKGLVTTGLGFAIMSRSAVARESTAGLLVGELIAANWAQWLKHDPVLLVRQHAQALRSLRGIYIDCGWRDQFHIHYGARILSGRLGEARIPHRYEEFDDDHSDIDYRMDVSLPFLYRAVRP